MTQDTFRYEPDAFREANEDYLKRIEELGVVAIYDSVLDALFIEIGGPREALTEHVVDNVMVRVEPETLEIVGLEILDFLEDFVPANRLVREAISEWRLTRDSDSQRNLMEPRNAPLKDVVERLIAQVAPRSAAVR